MLYCQDFVVDFQFLFPESYLYHDKIHISDNFWILQNVVPDFIDTDNCPLRMFPVLFPLSIFLSEVTRLVLCKKIARKIKLTPAYVDTVQ